MGAILALPGCDGESDVTPGQDPETLKANVAKAQAFKGPDQYWAGQSFEGLELDSVASPTNGLLWSFLYGECKNLDVEEAACNYPVSIQNESICERFPSKSFKLTRLRGAKAVWRGAIGALEVYTGRTTVVLFGAKELALKAAASLRKVSDTAPVPQLPPPAKGSLEGELACQARGRGT